MIPWYLALGVYTDVVYRAYKHHKKSRPYSRKSHQPGNVKKQIRSTRLPVRKMHYGSSGGGRYL
jgi:hypothetical protein